MAIFDTLQCCDRLMEEMISGGGIGGGGRLVEEMIAAGQCRNRLMEEMIAARIDRAVDEFQRIDKEMTVCFLRRGKDKIEHIHCYR